MQKKILIFSLGFILSGQFVNPVGAATTKLASAMPFPSFFVCAGSGIGQGCTLTGAPVTSGPTRPVSNSSASVDNSVSSVAPSQTTISTTNPCVTNQSRSRQLQTRKRHPKTGNNGQGGFINSVMSQLMNLLMQLLQMILQAISGGTISLPTATTTNTASSNTISGSTGTARLQAPNPCPSSMVINPSETLTSANGSSGQTQPSTAPAVPVNSGINSTTSMPACTTSNATGAGNPTKIVNVPVPSGDMTSAIKNALSSATGGGKVVLQAGTYTITGSLSIPSGVDFTGAGISSTTIKASDTSNVNPMVTVPSGNSNVTVENMTLNQNGSSPASHQSLAAYLIETHGTNTIFQQIATRIPTTYSMVAINANQFCFRNNNVLQDPSENGKYNQLDGIHIMDSSNGDVLNNFVDNAYNGAIDGDDGMVAHTINGNVTNVRYEGNVVRGGATAGDFDFAFTGHTISGIILKNNEFWGGPDGVRDADFGGGGTLSNVTITNNFSHNNAATPQQGGLSKRGYTLPYQSSIIQSNITVNGWYWCNDAGGAPVPSSGTSDGVTANGVVQYSTCTNAPSTTTPPAVYPPQ